MLQLRVFFVANVAFTRFFVANVVITRFFCRKCRDYALFGVEFWQKFWQKFLEILRILAEILRKTLATGVSVSCLLLFQKSLNVDCPLITQPKTYLRCYYSSLQTYDDSLKADNP